MLVGLLPSDVGDYQVYCFNEAVAIFGMVVEGELNDCDGKSATEIQRKQDAVLERLLGTKPSTTKGQFADPAAFFSAQVGDA